MDRPPVIVVAIAARHEEASNIIIVILIQNVRGTTRFTRLANTIGRIVNARNRNKLRPAAT